MLARPLVLSISSVFVLLGATVCASVPAESEPRPDQPVAFVEQQNTEKYNPAAGPPVEGLQHWAQPTKTADEFLAEARAMGIDAKRHVEVSTMQELIAALGSETVILLQPGRYVFEDSNVLGTDEERAVLPDWSSLSPHYDAGEIHDLHDLALVSVGPEPALIIQPDSYAPALAFRNVEDLALYNLAIGHRPEQGWCRGGVIRVIESKRVLVDGATLFGSGTEGLSLVTVDGLTLRDSVITDCSEQFSTISNSRDVIYERVEIVGNTGDLLRGFAVHRSTLTLVDSVIAGNKQLSWEGDEHNSYDMLFAIDVDFDFGMMHVDNPRPLEPERTASEVVLRRTSVDGELIDRTL
jgi:hypothetical protein